jgi:mannose/cellobiose epimerase-like protein (N-acyl-D-glucosamine 2-epimerase family)
MSAVERCDTLLQEVQDHLRDELLPFWSTRGVDKEHGGFLTYLDRNGNPTGQTDKTLVCQTRMIFTASEVHRAGIDTSGVFLKSARQGVDFLINHFWDPEYWGWYWVTDQKGKPINDGKLTYGHSFAIYALSEYGMASGDHRGLEWAIRTYEVLQGLAADNCYGGYYEFLERDFRLKPPFRGGGDRKSFDIHMHLMEAFTNLYEATGKEIYRRRAQEMVDLIFTRILDPESGTGMAQFMLDWTPVRAIIFDNVWGSDRDVEESDQGRPLDNTSYGHNIEFAWLLGHTIDILDLDFDRYKDTLKKIYDHTAEYGVDWERGGLYCEGPKAGPARERNKEFWQQAEALVGFADAYVRFQDPKYLDAYEKVHRFVFDKVINHEVGEWFPLFDENNNLLWDYMAHAWKINYHTVRSMIQTEKRLLKICG